MTEQEFWTIIESSWEDSPSINKLRGEVLRSNDEEIIQMFVGNLENEILENYRKRLFLLNKDNLTDFIHVLEEKLYKIDREKIHEFTDGSDDGFLYCRCFIVGMGEKYYKMIDENPSSAKLDLDAESFGFSAYSVYDEKFGEEFERNSIHCIESFSNEKAWNL